MTNILKNKNLALLRWVHHRFNWARLADDAYIHTYTWKKGYIFQRRKNRIAECCHQWTNLLSQQISSIKKQPTRTVKFNTASIHQYANKTNVKSERQATSHTGKQTGSLQWTWPLSSIEKQSHQYRMQVKPIFQKHQRIRLKESNMGISTLGTVLKRAFWEQEHHTRKICLHALDREEPQLHMCFYFTDYFIFDMFLNILFISCMCMHVHIWVPKGVI